jgi:hypothetical protein
MPNFSRFPFKVEVISPVFSQPIEIDLVAVFKFQHFIKGDREEEDVRAELIIDRIEPSDLVPSLLDFAIADHYQHCRTVKQLKELKESIRKDG